MQLCAHRTVTKKALYKKDKAMFTVSEREMFFRISLQRVSWEYGFEKKLQIQN